MKPDNWNRFAAGLLAILLCLCSFSMPAFASGSDPASEPLPEIVDEEPTTGGMEPEGVPITPIKPKPETEGKKGFVCKVCGYIYEGDELPADYICPLCKHGAADFEPIG